MIATGGWPKRLDRAVSAYAFLVDVLVPVLDEDPARVAMGFWIDAHDDARCAGGGAVVTGARPECGTVGCVGGWAEFITGGYRHDGLNARESLGLSFEQAEELFMPKNLLYAKNQGTRRHATAVVKHVRRFAEKYRAQLEQTTVIPAPGLADDA